MWRVVRYVSKREVVMYCDRRSKREKGRGSEVEGRREGSEVGAW